MAFARPTPPRGAIAVVAIALAASVGGCGIVLPTTGPPAPSAPSDPSNAVAGSPGAPSPDPTPLDASSAFVATVSDPGFGALVDVTGETTLGSVRYGVTGSMTIDGPDTALELTTSAGSRTSTVRSRIVDGSTYTSGTPAGMWFASDDPGIAGLAAVVLGSADGITDVGVETKGGTPLHHLVIPPPDSLADTLGVDRATYTSVTTTLDAWVEDDGTPAVVEATAAWTQDVNGKPVAATKSLELDFSPLPPETAIVEPDTAWTWSSSDRFKYRMAFPAAWTFRAGSPKYADAYYGFDSTAVFASRGGSDGLTLSQLSGALSRYLPQITRIKAPKVTSNTAGRLGSLPARRIEYTYSSGGVRYHSLMYLAVKGAAYYVVEYETQHALTDDDRAMAAEFARTFSPR